MPRNSPAYLGSSEVTRFVIQWDGRRQSGNLSVRNLTDVVSRDNFIPESEYMETVLVVVPRFAILLEDDSFIKLLSQESREGVESII